MYSDIAVMAKDAVTMIADKIKNLKTLNIIVAGKTGVGKSTLINAVFKDKLAQTGMGKPVTDHMREITKKDMPLRIYDTRGFELGKDVQKKVKQEVVETITRGVASKDVNNCIHCIWYCINTASNRVEPEEIEWLRELSKENQVTEVPIIVILTQSISKKNAQDLRKTILDENLDVIQVVPVLAEDYEINDEYVVKSFGLDELIQVMGQVLPDELVNTLQNVQIASLKEKKAKSHAAVVAATSAAVAEAAVPIPLADCAMLIPTQLGMIASITAIFGFDVNESILTAFISSTLGSGGATLIGKTLASLIKAIPGVGSIVGGTISAGIAGALTAALGEAYIGVMEMIFKGKMDVNDLNTEKGKKEMTTLFKERLKRKRNKKDLQPEEDDAIS